MLAFLIKIQVIPCQFSSKGESMHRANTFGLLLYKSIIYKRSTGTVILDLIIIKYRTLFSKNFGNRICKYGMICKALMTFYDLHLGILTNNYKVTGLNHQRCFVPGRKIDYLDGFVCNFIPGDMNKCPFLGKSSIQGNKTILL